MKYIHALALVLALLSAHAPQASAQQRNPLQKIGETVLDRASAHYRFQREVLRSADGARSWRVAIGVPRAAPPAQGFPVLYMLDGNAALMNFDEPLLAALAEASPHVLVFVGYDNDLRIDSAARTRDYTPRLTAAEDRGQQPHDLSGGADAFLETIERRIKPAVARAAPVDAGRQTLWGHSLGGLFVLHALFTRTGAFQTYAAGSPSIWWQRGYLLQEEERFVAHNAGQPARVLIMLGGDEREGKLGNRDMSNPRVLAHLALIGAVPPDAAMQMAERLARVPGLDADYTEFPGLGHGPMLRASLLETLEQITGARIPAAAKGGGAGPQGGTAAPSSE